MRSLPTIIFTLKNWSNLTAKIEEDVVEKTNSDILKRIFKLKSNMISFNKILWYERGLVFNLQKCDGQLHGRQKPALYLTPPMRI